jgi:hypothetical protein
MGNERSNDTAPKHQFLQKKNTWFFPQQQNGYPKIGVKRLPLNPEISSLRHRLVSNMGGMPKRLPLFGENDDNRDCHAASKPPSPA